MENKVSWRDVIAYLEGKMRYAIYFSKFSWMIRLHIREQITARLNSMRPSCYNNGQCDICKCETIALQMANKPCDAPCYPAMMNKRKWDLWKRINGVPLFDSESNTYWGLNVNKLVFKNYGKLGVEASSSRRH